MGFKAQVVTEDSASGAQVIDGSLRFDDPNQCLQKNSIFCWQRRTWTWSAWVKRVRFW